MAERLLSRLREIRARLLLPTSAPPPESATPLADDTVLQLLRSVATGDWAERSRAAARLGSLRDPRAAALLCGCLGHFAPQVRESAQAALIQIGGDAVPELCRHLHHHNAEVRWRSATAIGAIGDAGLEGVAECLCIRLGDDSWQVRNAASEALAGMGPTAVDVLCTSLGVGRGPARWWIADTLGALEDREAVQPLLQAIRDPDPVLRRQCCLALARIGDPAALQALCEALRDPKSNVREAAAESLGRFESREAEVLLCRALTDRTSRVRGAAAVALASTGTRAAISALCRALRDEDSYVCSKVARALSALALRDPHPSLRQAMPPLRRLLGPLAFEGPVQRATYLEALQRIEAATGPLKDLPRPSERNAGTHSTLPVPLGTDVPAALIPEPPK
jgi:HEAT repeat protein